MTREKIFLKNHGQNVVIKLVPDHFLKDQNWAFLWIDSLKSRTTKIEWNYQNVLTLRGWPLTFTSYKSFSKKTRKMFGTSLSASFSAWFLEKNISQVIFYQLTKFHCRIVFTSWHIALYVHCSYLFPSLHVIKFEINYSFLIKAFSCMTKKVRTNIYRYQGQKQLLRWNKTGHLNKTWNKTATFTTELCLSFQIFLSRFVLSTSFFILKNFINSCILYETCWIRN